MRRWMDPRQPQTLQTATVLAYLNGQMSLIGIVLGGRNLISIAFVITAIGALMMANELRIGYYLAVVSSAILLLLGLASYLVYQGGIYGLVSLVIYGALLALLLHRHSREFLRIWLR